MRDYPYLYGQLLFDKSFDALDNLFQDSNLKHEIRHSSHFQDGTYFRLSLNADTELTFERESNEELLIRGEANNQDDLVKLADITSSILMGQKLKHRLELYTPSGNELGFFHFNWTK